MILAALIALIVIGIIALVYLSSINGHVRIARELTRVQAQKIDVFLDAINKHILEIGAEIKKK
jgi:type II secretory pathway pseudopilin PulG